MRLAWINEKGGTLKTTLSTHTAVYLAAFRAEKTLLIDLDPQGQAGKSLGLLAADRKDAADWLLGTASLDEVAVQIGVSDLWIVPSSKRLVSAVEQLQKDGPLVLKEKLASVRKWKNIVIDSPPSIGWITNNILATVTDVFIPINLSYLALDGAAEMVQSVEAAKQSIPNKKLAVRKVVPTLYRRTKLADAILGKLQEHFGSRCASTRLSVSVKVDEAQSWGQTIWAYGPRTSASEQMLALMEELFGPASVDGFARVK